MGATCAQRQNINNSEWSHVMMNVSWSQFLRHSHISRTSCSPLSSISCSPMDRHTTEHLKISFHIFSLICLCLNIYIYIYISKRGGRKPTWVCLTTEATLGAVILRLWSYRMLSGFKFQISAACSVWRRQVRRRCATRGCWSCQGLRHGWAACTPSTLLVAVGLSPGFASLLFGLSCLPLYCSFNTPVSHHLQFDSAFFCHQMSSLHTSSVDAGLAIRKRTLLCVKTHFPIKANLLDIISDRVTDDSTAHTWKSGTLRGTFASLEIMSF